METNHVAGEWQNKKEGLNSSIKNNGKITITLTTDELD
jgi:hypothetical protein